MFAGKEDFKIAYGAKALETLAKPIEECTIFEQYEVLAYLLSSSVSKVRTQTSQRLSVSSRRRFTTSPWSS